MYANYYFQIITVVKRSHLRFFFLFLQILSLDVPIVVYRFVVYKSSLLHLDLVNLHHIMYIS